MKLIRILLSPIVFLFIFLSMTIIPIGLMCLVIGLINLLIVCPIMEEKIDLDNIEMTFIWFLLPYWETKKFIENKKN